jgi:hypothetical protein
MIRFMGSLTAFLLLTTGVLAADPVSFKDRRVTMIVGYAPGGGADLTGRLVAPLLTKYLPGNPTVIVQNMPGAEGIKALNYFVKQAKPDGLTIYVGSANELDPVRSRSSVAAYNPTKLNFIGGNVRFQSVILINKSAKNRLHEKGSAPVVMGTVGFPRSGAQTVAWGIEYLGWNAKWVTGYKSTPETSVALDRGEVDMIATSTNRESAIAQLRSGNFEVLSLAGTTPAGAPPLIPEFDNVPQLVDLLEGKIQDPIAKAAFEYWLTISSVDKWLTLPPDTPQEIVATYRGAFSKIAADPEFEKGAEFLELLMTDYRGFENAVKILDETPQEAVDFMASLLRKQGLDIAQ